MALQHTLKLKVSSPAVTEGSFAFATINGKVFLVQVSCTTPVSAMTTIDVKIFRHEFICIFRYAETKTLHPADILVNEFIDESLKCYDEEKGTVFLARDLMQRMRILSGQYTLAKRVAAPRPRHRHRYQTAHRM